MRYVQNNQGLAVKISNTYKAAQITGVVASVFSLLVIAFIDAHYYPITATISLFTIMYLLFIETIPKEASNFTNPKVKAASYFFATAVLLPFVAPSFVLFIAASLYLIDCFADNNKMSSVTMV